MEGPVRDQQQIQFQQKEKDVYPSFMQGMFDNDGLMVEDMMHMSQISEKFLNDQNYLNDESSHDNFDQFNDYDY